MGDARVGADDNGLGATAGTDAGTSSTSGAAGSTATNSGASGAMGTSGSGGSFEQACLASALGSCERCLCSSCTEQLQACANIPGCPEILDCTKQSRCQGIACYCGDFDAVSCLNGEANGPCKSAIVAAPGARVPTIISPSSGPASDAAVAISDCVEAGQPCAAPCSSR
jgi:hypothetical protein